MNATAPVSPVPAAGLLQGRPPQESRPQSAADDFASVFDGVQGQAQTPEAPGRGSGARQETESARSGAVASLPLDGGLIAEAPPVLLQPQMSVAWKDFLEPSGNDSGSAEASLAEDVELGPQVFVRAGRAPALQGELGPQVFVRAGGAPAGPPATVPSAPGPVQPTVSVQAASPGQNASPVLATLPGRGSPVQSASVAPTTAAGTAVGTDGELTASPLAAAVAAATVPPAVTVPPAANPARPVPGAATPPGTDLAATAPVGPAAPVVTADLSAPPSAAVAFVAAAATLADPGGAALLTAPAVSALPAPASPHHHLVPQLSRPLFTFSGASHGRHTMTLNVTPDQLGPLTVRAHIDASGVRIELFAPADAGREAVRSILHDLRRDLADSGFGATLELSDRSGPSDSGSGGRRGEAGFFGRPAADPLAPPSRAAAIREAVRPDGTATTLDILA